MDWMQFGRIANPLFVLFIVAGIICSCDSDIEKPRVNPSDLSRGPGRSVRFLSGVVCRENDYCDTVDNGKLWDACIENGYETQRPSGGIISSRPIKESVATVYSLRSTYQVRKKIIKTIPPGIVIEEDGPLESVAEVRERSARGYCIGSEYIVR